jgi:hypothetical protein
MINEYAALHLVGQRHLALPTEADQLRQARLARTSHGNTPVGGHRWAWRRAVLPVTYRPRLLRRPEVCPESAS